MSKEIFDEDSDGVFEDEEQEVAPKYPPTDVFKRNREATPSEMMEVVLAAKEAQRKPGRPQGSLNKNHEYKKKKLEQEEAIKKLWKLGKLHWKLDSNQKKFREIYYNHGERTFLPCLWARQIGKTYAVVTIINEEAITKPGIMMAYIAPKLNQARRIVNTKMREILADCPEGLRPKFNSIENKWTWPNGSELYLAGTDNQNSENIRGSTFSRVFIDEFCFLDDFEYNMNSIIFPTMMSVSDPFMVLISSPPKTADHESNVWLDEAEQDGYLIIRTIHDCPRHTPEKIQRIINEQYHGDSTSTDFRREMLCERIPDPTRLVLPEAAVGGIDRMFFETDRPDYYTVNEAFDWGAGDKNAGLFSYADYDNKVLVIEDEMWLDDVKYTTADIANEIRLKEMRTWKKEQTINRYGDNNNGQLLIDMSSIYKLDIMPTRKDQLLAAVNHVRNLIKKNQIIIHPRCVNLKKQMLSCTWTNADKKKFTKKREKNEETGVEYVHHYDLIAALIYLVRNSNLEESPFPLNYDLMKKGMTKENSFVGRNKMQGKEDDDFTKHLKNTFTIRKIR